MRKSFSYETKNSAIKSSYEKGIKATCEEFNISKQTLYRWRTADKSKTLPNNENGNDWDGVIMHSLNWLIK